jgi:glycosyltransferase involved in cell wall biosynthesis
VGFKYLFVINSFLAGGAERSLIELLPVIRAQDVTLIVACLYRREVGFEDEVRESGFDVRVLPGSNLTSKTLALRRLIKEERPDVVHTALFESDLAGRLASIGLRVPVMTTLANTAYDPARLGDPNVKKRRLTLVKWVDGFSARHLTQHFHAVSQAVKDSTVEHLRVPADRITVVKRGRDETRLGERTPERRRRVRRALGLDDDAEVLVAVGRQEYQKGHRHLIDAFPAVVAARPRARLLIVGREGHASRDLGTRIAALGLEKEITILGHREDVTDVMAACDLFVFPSVYEGLGGALIEAIGLGLPVVASDIPAIREVVRHGENADLVPPADSEALARAIVGLFSDRDRLHSYAKRSRQLFDEEFTAGTSNQRLLQLISRVAGEGRTGPR